MLTVTTPSRATQQRMMGYFLEEAKDHLHTLEQGLLNLPETLNNAEACFRATFALKGGAAMLGLNSVQKVSHFLEDNLKTWQQSRGVLSELTPSVDREIEALFLQSFDTLQRLIDHYSQLSPNNFSEVEAEIILQESEPVFTALSDYIGTLLASKKSGYLSKEGEMGMRDQGENPPAPLESNVTSISDFAKSHSSSYTKDANVMILDTPKIDDDYPILDIGRQTNRTGPEVGIAELNSLAELFEGESPDLDTVWEDVEDLEQENNLILTVRGMPHLESDDTGDFSDLLLFDDNATGSMSEGTLSLSMQAQMSMSPTTASEEDISNLFDDDWLEAIDSSDDSKAEQVITDQGDEVEMPVTPVQSSKSGDLDRLFGEMDLELELTPDQEPKATDRSRLSQGDHTAYGKSINLKDQISSYDQGNQDGEDLEALLDAIALQSDNSNGTETGSTTAKPLAVSAEKAVSVGPHGPTKATATQTNESGDSSRAQGAHKKIKTNKGEVLENQDISSGILELTKMQLASGAATETTIDSIDLSEFVTNSNNGYSNRHQSAVLPKVNSDLDDLLDIVDSANSQLDPVTIEVHQTRDRDQTREFHNQSHQNIEEITLNPAKKHEDLPSLDGLLHTDESDFDLSSSEDLDSFGDLLGGTNNTMANNEQELPELDIDSEFEFDLSGDLDLSSNAAIELDLKSADLESDLEELEMASINEPKTRFSSQEKLDQDKPSNRKEPQRETRQPQREVVELTQPENDDDDDLESFVALIKEEEEDQTISDISNLEALLGDIPDNTDSSWLTMGEKETEVTGLELDYSEITAFTGPITKVNGNAVATNTKAKTTPPEKPGNGGPWSLNTGELNDYSPNKLNDLFGEGNNDTSNQEDGMSLEQLLDNLPNNQNDDVSDFDQLFNQTSTTEMETDNMSNLDLDALFNETASKEDTDISSLDALFAEMPSSTDQVKTKRGEHSHSNTLSLLSESETADLDDLLAQISGVQQPNAHQGESDRNYAHNLDDLSDLTALLQGNSWEMQIFAELEQLLGVSKPTPVVAVASKTSATSTADDFEDMKQLIKDDDAKSGGGSEAVRSTRGRQRPNYEQTMRVPVKQLDNLGNLMGELVVNRNSLEQDQERMRQFLDNLMHQVSLLSDVGQRMQDFYERSLLEIALLASRQGRGAGHQNNNHHDGDDWRPEEMDRFTPFHTLAQEIIELIVRVRESAADIEFLVDEADQVTRQLRQITTSLQEGLTRSRMIPFSQASDRLPRAVRDIAIKCGKQAQLQVDGKDTLIDKMLLESLYDPMTHLVNNAIAHGVEMPEIRQNSGKPASGKISLKTFHQGNQTVISVSDDGAGIDVERVKQKAIEKGLITRSQAEKISRQDVYDLLFHPGFSTKDKADDYSGRGVGLDVVRTAINEVRGSISIDSTMGKGTSFTIRLPLTLSISRALCCVSDRSRIAFPMDGVEDMMDVPREKVQVGTDGEQYIEWRGTMLRFKHLRDLLIYNRHLTRGSVYGSNPEEDVVAVVLRSAGDYLAVQVDQVLAEQEIVIKQLEGPIPKPVGIAGATVLGDGQIVAIADVIELIQLAAGRLQREQNNLFPLKIDDSDLVPDKTEPTVLIVDDSITVRELLSMTFSKSGYRVEQARDGKEAWDKLRSGLPCDIVFCDIEMPRMDGLELLSRMQKDITLNHLPIAMLTSRGADRHRRMAYDLGAKGYFTKPYLEEHLLDAAQRMLKGEVVGALAAVGT